MKRLIPLLFSVLLISNQAAASSIDGAAQSLAKSAGITEDAAKAQIQQVFLAVEAQLKNGHEVTVRNFGRFYIQDRDARKGRNPKTGEAIDIPARRYARFSCSDALKEALNIPPAASAPAKAAVAPAQH